MTVKPHSVDQRAINERSQEERNRIWQESMRERTAKAEAKERERARSTGSRVRTPQERTEERLVEVAKREAQIEADRIERTGTVEPTPVVRQKGETVQEARLRSAQATLQRVADTQSRARGEPVVVSGDVNIPESNRSTQRTPDVNVSDSQRVMNVLRNQRVMNVLRNQRIVRGREPMSQSQRLDVESIGRGAGTPVDFRRTTPVVDFFVRQRADLQVGREMRQQERFRDRGVVTSTSTFTQDIGSGLLSGVFGVGEITARVVRGLEYPERIGGSIVSGATGVVTDPVGTGRRVVTATRGVVEGVGDEIGGALRRGDLPVFETSTAIGGAGVVPLTTRAIRIGSSVSARLRPDFIPAEIINTARRVTVNRDGVRVVPSVRETVLRDVPVNGGGTINVIVRRGVDSTAEDLSTQLQRAGTITNAGSGQIGLISRVDNIFSQVTGRPINVQLRDAQNLDTAFFASPGVGDFAVLRSSRMFPIQTLNPFSPGVKISFSGNRPQSVILPQQTIARFPPELQAIVRRVESVERRAGESLQSFGGRQRAVISSDEARLLERFQLETAGDRFTTPGFLSIESEIITTSPSLVVRRGATTVLEGQRVPIFVGGLTDDFTVGVSNSATSRIVDRSMIVSSPSARVFDARIPISSFMTTSSSPLRSSSILMTSSVPLSSPPSSPLRSSSILMTSSVPLSSPPSSPLRSSSILMTSSVPLSSPPSVPPRIMPPSVPPSVPPRIMPPSVPPSVPPRIMPPSSPPTFDFDDEEEDFRNIFLAQVRRGGRFLTIGSFESSDEALGFARARVRGTAAASLRVLDERTRRPINLSGRLDQNIFTPSKRDSNVFVERPQFRIDSVGELTEITREGQRALRSRRN